MSATAPPRGESSATVSDTTSDGAPSVSPLSGARPGPRMAMACRLTFPTRRL